MFRSRSSTFRSPSALNQVSALSQQVFLQQSWHLLLAMDNSAKHSRWPLDWPIADLQVSGLTKDYVFRFKLLTLEQSSLLGSYGGWNRYDKAEFWVNGPNWQPSGLLIYVLVVSVACIQDLFKQLHGADAGPSLPRTALARSAAQWTFITPLW